jgi:hypothetical protein
MWWILYCFCGPYYFCHSCAKSIEYFMYMFLSIIPPNSLKILPNTLCWKTCRIAWGYKIDYIDNATVKSDSMDSHLPDLCLALERMRRYGLKINMLKCAFVVSAGKFLGFFIHEHGIEIDTTKIESIKKVQPPQSKNDM